MKFDLTTKEGIEQARTLIAKQRRAQAIDQFHDALTAEKDTEALEHHLAEVELLNRFIEAGDRPKVEIIELDDIEVTDREWLIHQWLPANTVTMFTGDGGAGKSWLTLQVVCQIVCGFRDAYLNPDYRITPPADYDDNVGTPQPVVFATYEDEPAEIKRRIQALASAMPWIAESLDTTITQHLHIVDMRGIGSVWGPGLGNHIANTGDLLPAGEDLRAICEEKQARLLVMDPLSGAFGGNENDRSAVYDFVSSFRAWGDETQCAMLAIGHLPKGAEGRAAGFSGSTAWEAAVRSMWKLTTKEFKKDSEERLYWILEHTKCNYAPLQPEIPLIKDKHGWWKQADDKADAADGYDAYQAGLLTHTPQEETLDDSENGYNPYENAFR